MTGRVLTPAQQRVVDLMAAGWELGSYSGENARAWAQHGGCGRGGPSEDVRLGTLHALARRGLVRDEGRRDSMNLYALTDAGAALVTHSEAST